MKIISKEITKRTKGNCDIVDITEDVVNVLINSNIKNGICNIFSIGSTAGVTTIEYEPGLIKDVPNLLDKLIPSSVRYHHDDTWGDGNGHAHLRSALFKTTFTVPVVNGELTLGTWQQIVLIDFDNRERTRRIILQLMGE